MGTKFDDLKAGDPVVILGREGATRSYVSRVTSTLVVVAGQKYRKVDGRESPRSEFPYDVMSIPVKVLEHRACVDALKLADLVVEFVSAGLAVSPHTTSPALAARFRRELSAAAVKRMVRVMSKPIR